MIDPRLTEVAETIATRSPALALYARQWVGGRAAAEDVVQTMLISLLSLRSPPDDAIAWAYRAVRNGAIDAAKSEARRQRRERAVAADRTEWFTSSPGSMIDATAAEEAVRQLPPDLAEAVVLRVWGQLGFVELAGVAGCSVSTAHARFAAGLKQLRQIMERTWQPK
jgi:RNA polymerase sigma factor (sigma-70 family)